MKSDALRAAERLWAQREADEVDKLRISVAADLRAMPPEQRRAVRRSRQTQLAAAAACKISVSTLTMWEHCDPKIPTTYGTGAVVSLARMRRYLDHVLTLTRQT